MGQKEDPLLISVTKKIDHLSTTTRFNELDESTVIDTQLLSINDTKASPKCTDSDDDIPLIQLLDKSIYKPSKDNQHKLKRKTPLLSSKTELKKPEKPKTNIAKKIKSESSNEQKSNQTKPSIKQEKDYKIKLENEGPSKSDSSAEQEEEDDPWWLKEQLGQGSHYWETLEHNGVYFPPPYAIHNVPIKYRGEYVNLPPFAEEVATYFAGVVGTDYETNPIFISNFFAELKKALENTPLENRIVNFKDCDFSPIVDHLQALREKKKNRTKEEKLEEKKANDLIVEQYGYCMLDGKREKIGNFRIEPPGLFRGRGQHPKMGCLKKRINPEDITLNLGSSAPIPPAPEGHRWGKVINDPSVSWLATWTDSISGSPKYVFLGMSSKIKGLSDLKKFEKARELKDCVEKIRATIDLELTSADQYLRQRATAIWLIDRLALRAGNEKGEDEADTVGCCSLRREHISLELRTNPNNPKKKSYILIFDFLGKDSIRYYNEVSVPKGIYENMKKFSKKKPEESIFELISTYDINKYLTSFMPGLTAKVFRTYNASFTFQQELNRDTPKNGTVSEKILAYNRANRQVAVLCNHQRAVSKTHSASMERLYQRLKTLKEEKIVIKKELERRSHSDTDLREILNGDNSDCDDEKIANLLEITVKKETPKKNDADTNTESSQETKPVKDISTISTARLSKQFSTLVDRIATLRNNILDKDENKQTSLGTSKQNYIDPRITFAWCKKHKVPVEKLFSKTLREKFKWASHVDETWAF